jgi:hypothetical protein
MTCNTSAVAVCCSNASRVSVMSRAFSIAITAWAAKFCSNARTEQARPISGSGHLRLCRPVGGAAGQPQEADSPNSIEPS